MEMTVLNVMLLAVIAVPFVASLIAIGLPLPERYVRIVAFTGSVIGFGCAVAVVLGGRPWSTPEPVVGLSIPWIPRLGVSLDYQLDGLNAPLVLLTAALSVAVMAWGFAQTPHADHDPLTAPPPRSNAPAIGSTLMTVSAAQSTFLAFDLIVFFVSFELVLLPMYLLIRGWGDSSNADARRYAAWRFLLYTAAGSAIMLLGILLMGYVAGTYNVTKLLAANGDMVSTDIQIVAGALMLIGLAVKVPVWPVHSWLPSAHSIAPTVGSVLLAGVLLKMGTYGIIRLVGGVTPAALHQWGGTLMVLGVIGVFWGSLVCLTEGDVKRIIAYSSVAHMGFVLIGIGSGTQTGLQAAMFINVAHGLISALLFFVVGAIKENQHTSQITLLGSGLRDRTPRRGWLLFFGSAATLGLPGLAGFWGEFFAIIAAWNAMSPQIGRIVAVLAAIGTVFAAAYVVRVLYLLWQGPVHVAVKTHPADQDAGRRELFITVPFVVLIVVLGLAPATVLDCTARPVAKIVQELS